MNKETRSDLVKRVVRENRQHDQCNGQWRQGLQKLIEDMQKETRFYDDEVLCRDLSLGSQTKA